MSEEQEIDLKALEESIDNSQDEEQHEQQQASDEHEVQEAVEDFNIDEALDSYEPISLEGKITDEEAIEKATERGWREDGKDKFGHQISALEFLERTPLFHKMDLMRGDVEDLKKQNKKIIEQNKQIAQSKIDSDKKHVEDLKAQKETLLNNELLDADDIKELKTLDKQIDEAVVESPEVNETAVVQAYEDRKDKFMSENDWYNSNRAMTTLADSLGEKYIKDYNKEHGGVPDPEDLFEYVTEEIKKDFPDMGKPQRQTRVASRNNRTIQTNHKTKKTLDDIPEDQRAIAKEVMESAGLSEDEYLKTYVQ